MKVTIRERILLHLLDCSRQGEAFEVSLSLTQDGLAAAAWFHIRHAAQYLRPLLIEGLVRERLAHVKGARQRRKVYALTARGRVAALQLRESLREETVRVRDGQTERDASLGDVLEECRERIPPLVLVRQVVHEGIIDLAALASWQEPTLVEMLADAPDVDGFVGRTYELGVLTRQDDGSRLVVVLGLPGIGKSWLAAKACSALRGSRNLFWHQVQSWDTMVSLLAGVGRFLSALGRPALLGALARGNTDRAVRVLKEDLPGTSSFLVFDDAHEAGHQALAFFRLLRDVAARASDVRAAVLTRRALAFYDRRDVSAGGTVLELGLGELPPEDVAPLILDVAGTEAAEIGRKVAGYPLFFQLVRSNPTPARALSDLQQFMEEEIYRELTDAQRAMMKLASLYRIAVPRDAMFQGPSHTYDVLLSLWERSLVRRLEDGRFILHDTIRDFFQGLLTPAERLELGSFALSQLRSVSDRSLSAGRAIDARGAVANALELATEDQDRMGLWEAFGDATERMGDLTGALAAYREALNLGPDSKTMARLHRKAAAAFEDRGDIAAARNELAAAFRALGPAIGEERGWAYVIQSALSRWEDNLDGARNSGTEALRLLRRLGASRGEVRALLELGYTEYISPDGDAALAEDYLRRALALAEKLDDSLLQAEARILLANVVAYEGRPEEGLAHLSAVESMPGIMTDPHVRRSYLEMKGVINLLLDPGEAEAALAESLRLARKVGDSITEGMSEFGFGWVSLHRHHFDEARARIEAAFRTFRSHGLPGPAVEIDFYLALCALLQGDVKGFRDALAWLEDPAAVRCLQARYPRAEAIRGIGCLLEGDEAGVHESFSAALRSPRMQWAYFSHLLYGVALQVMGREREAREQLDSTLELARSYGWELPRAALPEMKTRLVEVLRHAVRPFGPRRL